MPERQKKRENQMSFELNAGEAQPQWITLQRVEEEAMKLSRQLSTMLPNGTGLRRSAVKMESYAEAKANSRIKLKTQVSHFNGKEVEIKVHCHRVTAKGKHQKLARVVYSFVKTASA